jgi:DNA ligase (NAD+)
MNIEGLGEKIIETLHDIGLITDVVSIFHLKKEDIASLEGFGEKSADNIIASINQSRTVPLHRFIYSLGIRHVGEQTAKDIAKHFKNIDALLTAHDDDFLSIEGVGTIVLQSLREYVSSDTVMTQLKRLIKELSIEVVTSQRGDKLNGMIFVITGTLPTLSRDEAKALIENNGGKVSGSVSKNTTYLLAGEAGGSKRTDAEKLGIKIINETGFKNML